MVRSPVTEPGRRKRPPDPAFWRQSVCGRGPAAAPQPPEDPICCLPADKPGRSRGVRERPMGRLAHDGWEVVDNVVPRGRIAQLWRELVADPGFVPGACPPHFPMTPWTCSAPPARWLRKRVRKAAPFRAAYPGLHCETLPGYLSSAARTDPRAEPPTTLAPGDVMVLGWTNLGADDDHVLVLPQRPASTARRPSTDDVLTPVVVPPGAHLFVDSRLVAGDLRGAKRRAGTAFLIGGSGTPLHATAFPILRTGFAVRAAHGRQIEGYAPTSAAVFAEPHRYVLPMPSGVVGCAAVSRAAYCQSPGRAYHALQATYRPELFGFDEGWPPFPPPFNDLYFYPELLARVYEDAVPPYTAEERALHQPTPIPSGRPPGILF